MKTPKFQKQISFRLSETELSLLEQIKNDKKLTRSETLRDIIEANHQQLTKVKGRFAEVAN